MSIIPIEALKAIEKMPDSLDETNEKLDRVIELLEALVKQQSLNATLPAGARGSLDIAHEVLDGN